MPGISSAPSSAVLTKNTKWIEESTRNTAGVIEMLYSELRRLRLGDTSDETVNLLRD